MKGLPFKAVHVHFIGTGQQKTTSLFLGRLARGGANTQTGSSAGAKVKVQVHKSCRIGMRLASTHGRYIGIADKALNAIH